MIFLYVHLCTTLSYFLSAKFVIICWPCYQNMKIRILTVRFSLHAGGDRYRQAENGSLIIESVRPEHSGLYQCTARNNFTQDQASATVTVTGRRQ